MRDLEECRACEDDAWVTGAIIWPGGKEHMCYGCGYVGVYYPQKKEVSEAQAKIDALRLREEITQAEIDVDAELHTRIAHETMLVLRRKQGRIEDKNYDTTEG